MILELLKKRFSVKKIAFECSTTEAHVYYIAKKNNFKIKKKSKVNEIGEYALKNGIKKASKKFKIRPILVSSYLWKLKNNLINNGIVKK